MDENYNLKAPSGDLIQSKIKHVESHLRIKMILIN